MKISTYQALCELMNAAEDTVPVFDGLTNHGWVALRANDRRERLKKAIDALRLLMLQEGPLDNQAAPPMVRHDGGFLA